MASAAEHADVGVVIISCSKGMASAAEHAGKQPSENTEVNSESIPCKFPEIWIKHEPAEADDNGDLRSDSLSWDIGEMKVEPKVEMTIEEHSVELRDDIGPGFCLAAPSLNGIQLLPRESQIRSQPSTSSSVSKKKGTCIKQLSKPELEVGQFTGSSRLGSEENDSFISQGVSFYATKTQVGDRSYSCETCGKQFSRYSDITSHMRVHTGEKPYKCQLCGKCFSHSSNLSSHVAIHSGEKRYKCDLCGKSFARRTHLASHKESHKGEKPHHCELCGKRFTQRSSLSSHLRIHLGERTYTCEICGFSFTHQSYLTKHLQLHTGEKPHGCQFCSKFFSTRSNLLSHLRLFHGLDKKHKCEACEECFSSRHKLQKHLQLHVEDHSN